MPPAPDPDPAPAPAEPLLRVKKYVSTAATAPPAAAAFKLCASMICLRFKDVFNSIH